MPAMPTLNTAKNVISRGQKMSPGAVPMSKP